MKRSVARDGGTSAHGLDSPITLDRFSAPPPRIAPSFTIVPTELPPRTSTERRDTDWDPWGLLGPIFGR